jgi:hypothetical protein
VIAKPIRAAVFVALLAALVPFGAQAKSKPAPSAIHGFALTTNRAVIGETGNCYCEAQWYTVGLRPGKTTVSITLISIGMKMGPSYSLRADLERRNQTILNQGQDACWRDSKRCTVSFHFTAKVFHAAPYYIHVIGNGAEGMQYRIQVQGSIYRVK